MGNFIKATRERKIWRAATLYLVISYGLVEAAGVLFPRLQIPVESINLLLAVLLFGFAPCLLITWLATAAHAKISVHKAAPLIALFIIALPSIWLGNRALAVKAPAQFPAKPNELPLVIMMDSPHPDRVYDQETLAVNGSNADVISDILLDLPIRRQRESIGVNWHRDEDVLRFEPSLIIIHYSGFRQGSDPGVRARLRLFISYFVDTQTQFILYSRAEEPMLRKWVDELLADLDAGNPGLLDRVSVFGLGTYGARVWRSPMTANPLKLRVKKILHIE